MLFLGVVTITVINGMKQPNPPTFAIETINQFQASDGYHVVIDVLNTGDETAAAVKVGAYLKRAGTKIEERDVEIEFMPPHSRRTASIVFLSSADSGEIGFEVLSFRAP